MFRLSVGLLSDGARCSIRSVELLAIVHSVIALFTQLVLVGPLLSEVEAGAVFWFFMHYKG